MRTRHMSPRSEKAYVAWCRRYVRFCGMRHPRLCGMDAVRAFLESLALGGHVSASTQNQALAALLFLYNHVLNRPLGQLPPMLRAQRRLRVPNVLEPDEVLLVIERLPSGARLVVEMLYGAGLRLSEALQLRVKDVDLRRRTLVIRDGKGGKDRRSVLPDTLLAAVSEQIVRVRRLHLRDVRVGGISIPLPEALAVKYPSASQDWRWAWLFPASRTYQGKYRYHLHPSAVQRAIAKAARESGLNKRVTAHTFRHSFATHLLRAGTDIRTVQELLGHNDVSTTMQYLHVLERYTSVRSPLDRLLGDRSITQGDR
jgi:integron integrase